MSDSPIAVVIHYQALPGKGGEARRELAALIAEVVRREPACLAIRLHQDQDDETNILLYEEWTDRESYTGPHMRTPHITAFISKAPTFMAGPPTITFWSIADEVRQPTA